MIKPWDKDQSQDYNQKGLLYAVHNLAKQEAGFIFELELMGYTEGLTVKRHTKKNNKR